MMKRLTHNIQLRFARTNITYMSNMKGDNEFLTQGTRVTYSPLCVRSLTTYLETLHSSSLHIACSSDPPCPTNDYKAENRIPYVPLWLNVPRTEIPLFIESISQGHLVYGARRQSFTTCVQTSISISRLSNAHCPSLLTMKSPSQPVEIRYLT